MTLSSPAMVCSRRFSFRPGAFHAPRYRSCISASLALIASAALAFAKDSVTVGIVLEPAPGLDPTSAPAAAIGQVTHYKIFEGLTKINEDFSVTPLLAESGTFSPDLKTLTFKLRPNVKYQDGEPFSSKDVKFSFERFGAKDSTNKDKAFFASIESIETPDPNTVVLHFKEPSFQALFHLGTETAVIIDEKSAAGEATNPVGTGPYKLANWTKGASVTLDKWDGFRDAAKIHSRMRPSASSPIRRRRWRPCSPATSTSLADLQDVQALASSRTIRASRCSSAAPKARRSWL